MYQSFSFPSLQKQCNYSFGLNQFVVAIPSKIDFVYFGVTNSANITAATSYIAYNITQCSAKSIVPLDGWSQIYGSISPLDPSIVFGLAAEVQTGSYKLLKLQYSDTISVLAQVTVELIKGGQIIFLANNSLLIFSNGSHESLYAYLFDLNLNLLISHEVAETATVNYTIIGYSTTNVFIGTYGNKSSTLYQYDINGDFSAPQSVVNTEVDAFRKWETIIASQSTVIYQLNETSLTVFDYDPKPLKPTSAASTASTAGSTSSRTGRSTTTTITLTTTSPASTGIIRKRGGGNRKKAANAKKIHLNRIKKLRNIVPLDRNIMR